MRKKTFRLLACLLALTLMSTTAFAAEEISSISVIDITPSAGSAGSASGPAAGSYTAANYYPVEIKTATEGSIQLLIKTFIVPAEILPEALIEDGLERHGVKYEVSDILKYSLPDNTETKQIQQTVTTAAETDSEEEALASLLTSISYNQDGYTGTLVLDNSTAKASVGDVSGYTYTVKDTRDYTGLERNDPYYIAKTVEKNGVTLSLADIEWKAMSSGSDNSRDAILYSATALYTGQATGSKADSYEVTAVYTGEVMKSSPGDTVYSIVYKEIEPILTDAPVEDTSSGLKVFLWVFGGLLLIGGIAFAAFKLLPRRQQEPAWEDADAQPASSSHQRADLAEALNDIARGGADR